MRDLLDQLGAINTAPEKPTVDRVGPLVREFYGLPGNGVGGSLHIVLDDGNVEDGSVRFCRDYALEHGDAIGYALANVLLRMSKTQRHKLYRGVYGK
jgi:hypothetical protein